MFFLLGGYHAATTEIPLGARLVVEATRCPRLLALSDFRWGVANLDRDLA